MKDPERIPVPMPPRRKKPKLLSGGNPQVPKGSGEAPVRAYLRAMPGWKAKVGRELDALVTRAVPGVQKAVKYNSPLYGLDGETWFLGFHCMTSYVKVAFFRGALLDPPPPEPSKQREVRYLHLREGEPLDEARIERWTRQAAALPGERI